MIVLEKIKEVVVIWWSFEVCGVVNVSSPRGGVNR